jgi:YbbR domain-containing protein
MAWHPFRNIGLKITALLLGLLLWYTVSGHQIERRLTVPVFYSNLPSPLELTGDQLDAVSVHVRGDDSVVGPLTDVRLQVVVDLGDAHSGLNIIPLRVDDVVAPAGVEVVMVEPGTVAVTLERTGQLDVAVNPTVEGQPAPGYVRGEAQVDPPTVTVAGPVSRLKDRIQVITERVLIDGRTSTLVQDVGVGVLDSQVRVVTPHTVRVTVPITPKAPAQP